MTDVRRAWARVRWRLRARRCGCGQYRVARGTSMELAGVKHRAALPCFHCDDYGHPL